MDRSFIVEFPPETAVLIEELAASLRLTREDVISRALGLLQVWVQAKQQKHIIIERPVDSEAGKEETEIDVNTSVAESELLAATRG